MEEESSTQKKYEVERILDRRIRDSRVEYFIKWKGYPGDQATWEPIQNLRNVIRAVLRFEKTARLSAQRRRARRALITGNLGKPRNIGRSQSKELNIKKLFFNQDSIQTIIIDDEINDVDKREDQQQDPAATLNSVPESQELPPLGAYNPMMHDRLVVTSQKSEVAEKCIYEVTRKDGLKKAMTKEQLQQKHSKQYRKYLDRQTQKREQSP